jgi:small-conductance mechanosensitive channel/CRP-like cAMP-binding protein
MPEAHSIDILSSISGLSSVQNTMVFLALFAIVFYLLGLVIARWLKHQIKVKLGWVSHVFVLCLAITAARSVAQVNFSGAKEIALVAAITAAFPLNALLHRFIWPLYGYPGENARIPNFLPQVAGIIIVGAALFTGLALFYHITIPGLLAGSGLIAIVVGLALQDTLGNIFAGFGLQAGRAYRVGDWLLLDGQHVEVVEINWRSTRLRNNDAVSLDIPNAQLAKATIVNLYYPTPLHGRRIRVSVDDRVPPNDVKDALIKATASAPGVLSDPPVTVFLVDFGEACVRYEIRFWLIDGRQYAQIQDSVRSNIWYELERRGIQLAYPIQTVQLERESRGRRDRQIDLNLLTRQPLFGSLDSELLNQLANGAKRIRFGKGEQIIRQGEQGDSMFILEQGQAEVLVQKDGYSLSVGGLSAGDCFGEMSLLTGEQRSATVVATVDCEVVEIQKNTIAPLLREHPSLANSLSETLATRKATTETELAKNRIGGPALATNEIKEGFLRKLRQFFEL